MNRYESDLALQELYDEMYREEKERPETKIGGMSQGAKFMAGLFVGIVILLYAFDKIDGKKTLIILGAGAIIYFIFTQSNPEKQELSYIECMVRINDQLKFLQEHPIGDIPQIPRGDIHVTPIGRKIWFEGRSSKRSYGVNIYDKEKDITEIYYCEIDIFSGDIITMKSKPEGVYGDETTDTKLIPSLDLFMHKKKERYLGKSYMKT